MSVMKYQSEFAADLAEQWVNGNQRHVRSIIRQLKNKAQAAYIASEITRLLIRSPDFKEQGERFVEYIHPNNK